MELRALLILLLTHHVEGPEVLLGHLVAHIARLGHFALPIFNELGEIRICDLEGLVKRPQGCILLELIKDELLLLKLFLF